MKEHAKNALAHDIELFGKTVSTVAIAAIFLIGAGSAALLTSYGTVQGTADVDQSVTFGQDGDSVELTNLNSQEAAGSRVVDTTWLNNTLERDVEVAFNSTQNYEKTQTVEGDVAGIQTGFVVFDGFAGEVEHSPETEDSSTVSFVIDEQTANNIPAVKLRVDKESTTGTAYAGIELDVPTSIFDGSNTIEIDYRKGSNHQLESGSGYKNAPDHIIYTVEATSDVDTDDDGDYEVKDEEVYKVADFTVDESSPVSLTFGDGTFGDDPYAYPENGNPFGSNGVTASALKDSSVVKYATIQTGTSGDAQDSELYLHQASFNDEKLMETVPHVHESPVSYMVPEGDNRVKVVNEFAVNIKPGKYSVSAEARPLSGQQP